MPASKKAIIIFELWHHEGCRARHAASMQCPDYTHGHGTCDLARHFYTRMVPEPGHLAEKGRASADPGMARAADARQVRLDEVLNSRNHQWYPGKMDPKEKARRKKAAEEFKARYAK